LKVNGFTNQKYSPLKTTSRNFNMLNMAFKQRVSNRKKYNKFTGKELDPETGLYYYGARYLDPKTSRWLSGDPAMGEYLPSSGQEAGKLPGQGGVFNTVNLHAYHYAGNNPVKYVDPDGRDIESLNSENNEFFRNLIIQVAGEGFYFDENNKLQINDSIEPTGKYSQTARDQLIAGINNKEKTAYLKASTTFGGQENQGELGMARWVDGNANAMVAFVYGPNPLPNINTTSVYLSSKFNANRNNAQAIGLVHELLGHVLPSLGITNEKSSMELERKVRGELGWGTYIGTRYAENSVLALNPSNSINLERAKGMK
jgi:RHS repeat-associated protein